ncbi:MAG: sugar transferase [Myxococcales bacterium]|nr:sugar transferase [Myxococcales bacterium]
MSSSGLWRRGGKRLSDILLAGLGLAAVGPLLIGSAVAIKMTSPGPVLFKQQRTGRDGRRFDTLKFRTMTVEEREVNRQVTGSSPGVTAVGKQLRRYKLDELPQLLNILRGDMSIVGPRPTLPVQTDAYDSFERRRLDVRPGLTGLAQVNGNASLTWPERIKYDVVYVDRHDLWMDIHIVLKTIAVVVLGEERFARRIEESPYAALVTGE